MDDLQGKKHQQYVVILNREWSEKPEIYGLNQRMDLMTALDLLEQLAMGYGDFVHATLHAGQVHLVSQDELNGMT